MQTDLVNQIFPRILDKFSNFFELTDVGFRNELIVQMYSRRHEPQTEIIWHGQRFASVKFLVSGCINMLTQERE